MPTEKLRQHGENLTDTALARRLNGLLRAGLAQLDFTGITGVSDDFARALLDGLDLGMIGDSLGAETMSPEVSAVFAQQDVSDEPAPVEVVAPVIVGTELLNPITVLDETIRSYRDYLLTEFRARDPDLRRTDCLGGPERVEAGNGHRYVRKTHLLEDPAPAFGVWVGDDVAVFVYRDTNGRVISGPRTADSPCIPARVHL